VTKQPKTARDLLAAVLRTDVSQIPENPTVESFTDWDSLTHVELVMAIEDEIGRELTGEEVGSISGIGDVEAILQKASAG